jgi:hypothetical protein
MFLIGIRRPFILFSSFLKSTLATRMNERVKKAFDMLSSRDQQPTQLNADDP